jgi:hypothetical protein
LVRAQDYQRELCSPSKRGACFGGLTNAPGSPAPMSAQERSDAMYVKPPNPFCVSFHLFDISASLDEGHTRQ